MKTSSPLSTGERLVGDTELTDGLKSLAETPRDEVKSTASKNLLRTPIDGALFVIVNRIVSPATSISLSKPEVVHLISVGVLDVTVQWVPSSKMT